MKPIHNIFPFLIIAAVFTLAWLLLTSSNVAESPCSRASSKSNQDKDSNQTAGEDNLFNEGFFRINTTLR